MAQKIKPDKPVLEKLSLLSPEEIAELKLSKRELLSLLSETLTEKNKVEGVLQSIDNGVFAVDWDGKIILFNRAAEEMTKLKKEEIIGQFCEQFLYLIDEKGNSQSADAPLADAFSTEKDIHIPLSYLKSVKQNGKIPVSVTYISVKGIKDALVLGICVFKDLRKQKELEKMKSDFVSMAAHELRTPLTSIRGYLSVLDEELTDIDEEYQEFIKRALTSAMRLDTLVKNMLSVAKIERGKIPLFFSDFPPNEDFEIILNNLKNKIDRKKIKITIEVDESIKTVYGDRDKIKEVLINFIENAVNYTPVNGKIDISVKKKNRMVEFRVTDSGIGLSRKDQKKLFQKFSQIKKPSMTDATGTGLGLYISKLIIKMHKGKIGVRSEGDGKGSSFFFLIPERKEDGKKVKGD